MQFPESWLREFCNPPISTQALADTLTMAGLEVEELQPVAPPFTGIVVGEIKEAVQHPDADRLRVCKVDVAVAVVNCELIEAIDCFKLKKLLSWSRRACSTSGSHFPETLADEK